MNVYKMVNVNVSVCITYIIVSKNKMVIKMDTI